MVETNVESRFSIFETMEMEDYEQVVFATIKYQD